MRDQKRKVGRGPAHYCDDCGHSYYRHTPGTGCGVLTQGDDVILCPCRAYVGVSPTLGPVESVDTRSPHVQPGEQPACGAPDCSDAICQAGGIVSFILDPGAGIRDLRASVAETREEEQRRALQLAAASQLPLLLPSGTMAELGRCPECSKPVRPALGPAQRALLPGVPELHAACLVKRQDREARS